MRTKKEGGGSRKKTKNALKAWTELTAVCLISPKVNDSPHDPQE